MNDKKHIDRLFQEKLKDFEATQSHAVWENISAELQAEEKDRKVIPLWLKLSAIAAVLLLLFTVGSNVFNTSDKNPDQNTIVDTNTNSDTDSNELNPDNKTNDAIDNSNTLKQDELASENDHDNIQTDASIQNSESNKLTSPNNKASNAAVATNSNQKSSDPSQDLNQKKTDEIIDATKSNAVAQTDNNNKKDANVNTELEGISINKQAVDNTLNKNSNTENAVTNASTTENNKV